MAKFGSININSAEMDYKVSNGVATPLPTVTEHYTCFVYIYNTLQSMGIQFHTMYGYHTIPYRYEMHAT